MLNMSQFPAQALCGAMIFKSSDHRTRGVKATERCFFSHLALSVFANRQADTKPKLISVLQGIGKIVMSFSETVSGGPAQQRHESNRS